MTSPVTIEWGGGTFRAWDGAGAVAEGPTLGEAVARLEAEAGPPVPPPVVTLPNTPNPIAAVAGSLKGHPLFDDYLRAIQENRRLTDAAEDRP